MIRIIKGIILAVATVFLCMIIYEQFTTYYDAYMEEYQGTYSYVGEDVTVVIPEKASVKKIASILKEAGLIEYERAFVNRLKDSEYRGRLKHGTFVLNTGMNTLEMMEVLSPVDEVNKPIDTLVIPEGFTIEQIADRCEKQDICTASEFINAVNSITTADFPYLADVPAGADVKYKLQGYLFPATYDIYADTTAKSLVEWMLDTFEYHYSGEIEKQAMIMNLNSYEVITRASIIEREARVHEERAIIAGVINNRLSTGMPLQMCPTVLYPLTDGLYNKGQVYYEDLELESPYNTYKYTGLPVGPICNPGKDCINAVLYPETHNFLYYHVDNEEEGTHIFTENYEDHIDTQIIGGPNGVQE